MGRMRYTAHLYLVFSVLGFCGCTEVPPTNPYDPAAPVELQRKASLAGVVRDALTQVALEGAIVQLVGPTDPSNNPVTTDGDGNVDDGQDSTGTFRFEGLAPGRYTLEVKHAAHVQQVIDLGRIEAGEEVSREILLVPLQAESERVSRITGVAYKEGQLAIEDETLRDHSGITVEVVGAGVRTVTNRAGDFDIFVNAGTYTLALTSPNYERYETAPIELSSGAEVVLEEPITLQSDPGVVTGIVTLEGAGDDGHGDITVTLANTSLTAQTGDDGRFRLDDVPAGIYTLRAAKSGFETAVRDGVVVNSHPDTELDAVALRISRGHLQGTLNLVNSSRHGGIAVELLNTTYSTFSNADGAWRLDDIPVGDYTVRACIQGYEPIETNIAVNANTTRTLPVGGDAIELPRQQIVIADDPTALITASRTFTLAFSEVPAWVTAVRLTGDLAGSETTEFRPYDAREASVTFDLSDADGSKLVQVQFRGDGCRISDVFPVAVLLDTSAPVLVGVDLPDARPTADIPFTNVVRTRLTFQAFGANELRLTGDDVATVGGLPYDGRWFPAPESSQVTVTLELNGEADGRKTFTLDARDAAGNVSAAQQVRIALDRVPPRLGEIIINDPQPITDPDGIVNLSLTAVDADQMQVSNTGNFANARWEAYSDSARVWALADPETDGPKTIFARFMDQAGNISEIVSTPVTFRLDRVGQIEGSVLLEGGAGTTDVQLLLDGEVVGNPSVNGSFTLDSVPVGLRTVTARLADYTLVDAVEVEVGPEASIPNYLYLGLTHDYGTLTGSVIIDGPGLMSDVTLLIDGAPAGSPNADGSFSIVAPISQSELPRTIGAQLADHTTPEPVEVVVTTVDNPNLPPFELTYRFGAVRGTIDLADTDACGGADVLVDDEAAVAIWNGCEFRVEGLSADTHRIRVVRPSFESIEQIVIVRANRTTTIANVFELPRSLGAMSGFVELQSRNTHGGIQLIFTAVDPPFGTETPRSYTTLTFDSGRFEQVDMRVGNYEVYAQAEGYVRAFLGEFSVIRNTTTTLNEADTPVVLARQVGDFLVNDGALFARNAEVALSLGFPQVKAFRVRVNADSFDTTPCPDDAACDAGETCFDGECWIRWNDPDGDGLMVLGDRHHRYEWHRSHRTGDRDRRRHQCGCRKRG